MKMKKISKSSTLKCVFCQGKGVQPGAERLSCIVCRGSGRITVKQPCSICKECGGRGKKAGTNLYCLSCQGRGFIEEKKYPSVVESSRQRKEGGGKRKKNPPSLKLWRARKKRAKKSKGKKESKKPFKAKSGKSFFKGILETFKIL